MTKLEKLYDAGFYISMASAMFLLVATFVIQVMYPETRDRCPPWNGSSDWINSCRTETVGITQEGLSMLYPVVGAIITLMFLCLGLMTLSCVIWVVRHLWRTLRSSKA
jgi:hypothetical protein